MAKISDSDSDIHTILSLAEMAQRGFRQDADEHTKNEAHTATSKLAALLSKYGLDLTDLGELKRQHQEAQAAKAAQTATPAAAPEGPNVLELTIHVLRSYFEMTEHLYCGVALWILHAHVFDRFQISPRLAVLSAKRGCGKTNLLKVAERLTPNPERHDGITAAALFRLVDRGSATLLLDEGDNLGLRTDRVFRRVLNSGYGRGGKETRTIRGEDKSFSTWAPTAIAAIGLFPLPLMHRSIVIRLHPATRIDLKNIEALNTPEETQRLDALRQHIVAWAQRAQFDFNPPLPKILRGRPADNWRVLLAVADSLGSAHWSKVARDTAIAFAEGFFDEDAIVALLANVRLIFRRLGVDRIKSAVLAQELQELEDGAGIWSAWRGENDDLSPHPISQGEIAALLHRLGDHELRPKSVFELGGRKDRGPSGKGYYKRQLEKWFVAYCAEENQEHSADVRKLRTSE